MEHDSLSRRSFLKRSTIAGAGASAFTIVRPEMVRAAGKERLKIGLVGVGGRGTQACIDTLNGNPNVEITVLGDIFEDHLERQLKRLQALPPDKSSRVKVDAEHRFVGFDAYKKVLASDIDYVILATPPGYRPEHFEAAVNAKKHIFCEKPFGTDPVGVRRFMDAAKKSVELKLSVKSGAQRRSQAYYLDQLKRVRGGDIGDIVAAYAYWVGGPVLQFQSPQNRAPQDLNDPKFAQMEIQHRNWYSYVWICGDQVVEQHLHNIDVCNWFMGTHPVRVVASGGVAWRPRQMAYGNIYDHLSADFEYPNGVHMSSYCRQYPKGSAENVSELIVGTKGRLDTRSQRGGRAAVDPYVQEHIDLANSILGSGPYVNEAMEVAESTMTCIMARESAYSGQALTWDQMMSSKLDLQPKAFDYNINMNVPPLPVPGEYKFI